MRGVLSTSVTVKDEFCFWVSLCPCHFESRCDQLGAVLSGYFVCDNFAGKQIQNHTGVKIFYKKQTSRTGQGIGLTALVSGSEVVNLQIKDIINEIRPVVINKKRTELDARHDIGRENKVTEIMELISTKNIDLMEYLESMLYRVIQRVNICKTEID